MAKQTAGSDQTAGSERILNAALALFKARGYHGSSVRELAQAVKMESASLYYHFPSKQHILFALFERIMDTPLVGVGRALASASTPVEQLRAAARFHVLYHIAMQDEAFISHSELRSLSVSNRQLIIAMRDRYEQMIRAVLTAGVRTGDFEIADVKLTSTAILMMCSGVSDWFVAKGRLNAKFVADRYADLVIRLVSPAVASRTRQPATRKPSRKTSGA